MWYKAKINEQIIIFMLYEIRKRPKRRCKKYLKNNSSKIGAIKTTDKNTDKEKGEEAVKNKQLTIRHKASKRKALYSIK